MATKVALTAEEFRENSQRSIALFNTEKLSTNSTHVLKSAYCNSVHFCSCNLHGACGGKVASVSDRQATACCNLHGACGGKASKNSFVSGQKQLQSARSVWRQRLTTVTFGLPRLLQSARSVWRQRIDESIGLASDLVAICTERVEAKKHVITLFSAFKVAICTERVEAKLSFPGVMPLFDVAICTERVEAKRSCARLSTARRLQSARSVWRQRACVTGEARVTGVAICTERVEAKVTFLCVSDKSQSCNLHGACGGKD